MILSVTPNPHTYYCVSKYDVPTCIARVLYAGWWFVQDENSRTGWIPATYLRPIVDSDHTNDNEGVVGTDRKVYKEHTAQKDDELTIEIGDTVEVLQASKEGWWIVR